MKADHAAAQPPAHAS